MSSSLSSWGTQSSGEALNIYIDQSKRTTICDECYEETEEYWKREQETCFRLGGRR